jgi:hypothetical protein
MTVKMKPSGGGSIPYFFPFFMGKGMGKQR